MKEIKAVIQPFRLPRVRAALYRIPDFPGMTVTRAEGSSHPTAVERPAGIKGELTDFSAKVRIEIVAPDALAGPIREAIAASARTGQPGDGLVWVTEVEQSARIRDAG